jgi:predicted CopG family antitoxin
MTVREEVYARLLDFMKAKALTSLSDAIALLLDYREVCSKVEELLGRAARGSNVTADNSKTHVLQPAVYTVADSKAADKKAPLERFM